ncbi:MAG: hypothetical protein WD021_03040 [Rhodothermales bacterium]
MPLFRHPVAAMLVAACALVAACDQAPGPQADLGRAPVLSQFSFAPHVVAVPAEGESESLVVPLSIEVAVTEGDRALETVSFVVQSPVAGASSVARGTLTQVSGNRFVGGAEFSIPVGEVGVYTVLVYAVDAAGTLSNEVRGTLRVEGVGRPPVVEFVVAPDTVYRPQLGEEPKRIPIVAVVSDPEGLRNINAVQFWNAASPAARFDMFDTGELGDEVAGDGRYTRVVEIASSNQGGTNTFVFQAVDLSGLASNTVEKSIVVE